LDPKDIYESDPTGDFGISWAEYYLIMQRIMARTIYPGETDKMGLSLMNYLECVDFDNYTIEDDEDGIGQKCRIAMRKQIEGMTSIRDAFKDSFPHPKASIETEGAINFQAIYPRILAGYEDREGINEMGLPIRFAGCPSYVLEGYIHLLEFTLSMAGEWKPGLED